MSDKDFAKLVKQVDPSKPIVIVTPVNRYLGFSAPVSPVDQFSAVAKELGVPIAFKDPQRVMIKVDKDTKPVLYDQDGRIEGSAFFGFGHDHLDRNMVRFITTALELTGVPLVNGTRALTYADDKAMMAIAFAGQSDIPTAQSVIASARGHVPLILDELDGGDVIVMKMSGYTGGGVGTQPMQAKIDYIAPALWMSRMDNRPRVVQNDADKTALDGARTVIRAYIVGGELIGCYTTKGYGLVNSAGLARESEGLPYDATQKEKEAFLRAAEAVGASGYCRIDAAGGDNFCIFEVNPLARIDAEKFGLDIPRAILKYAVQLAVQSKENVS